MTVIQIDISKAFDSLAHDLIQAALRAKGVPDEALHMIGNAYANARTKLKSGNDLEIQLKRGIKQGDPISPSSLMHA